MKASATDYGVEATFQRSIGNLEAAERFFTVAAQKATHANVKDQYQKQAEKCRRKAARENR